MTLTPYRRILAVPQVRTAVLLGVASRMPMFAGGVLITLHVVTGLGRGYAQAGVVTMAYTTAVAVAGPWRGRVLDRRGLRRAVLPSLILMTLCWSVAPFVEYAALLALAIVAGLVNPPVFAIVRQAMMTAASPEDRRTALSLDAVAVEVSFMIGPLLAVWAATTFPTSWSLYVVQMLAVAAAAALWVADPPLTRGDEPALPQARAPCAFLGRSLVLGHVPVGGDLDGGPDRDRSWVDRRAAGDRANADAGSGPVGVGVGLRGGWAAVRRAPPAGAGTGPPGRVGCGHPAAGVGPDGPSGLPAGRGGRPALRPGDHRDRGRTDGWGARVRSR
ncbi:MAG: MFS transporter [Austwickia sp.]|nr:MFS transporter [Austwickia sp.]